MDANGQSFILKAIKDLPCKKEYYVYYGNDITNPKEYKFPYPLNETVGFHFATFELIIKSITDTNVKFYDSLPAGKWEKYKCVNNQIKLSNLKTISNFALNGLSLSLYESGNLKQIVIYKNNRRIGYDKHFYENGMPAFIAYHTVNKHNPEYMITYFDSAKVASFTNYIGLQETNFFKTGKIKSSGSIDYRGYRQGEWMYYNENGELLEIVLYKDHEAISNKKIK